MLCRRGLGQVGCDQMAAGQAAGSGWRVWAWRVRVCGADRLAVGQARPFPGVYLILVDREIVNKSDCLTMTEPHPCGCRQLGDLFSKFSNRKHTTTDLRSAPIPPVHTASRSSLPSSLCSLSRCTAQQKQQGGTSTFHTAAPAKWCWRRRQTLQSLLWTAAPRLASASGS